MKQYPFQIMCDHLSMVTVKKEITENWCEMVEDMTKTPGALEGLVTQGLSGLKEMTAEELVGVYLGLRGISVGDVIVFAPLLRILSDDATFTTDDVLTMVNNWDRIKEFIKQLE